jgi:small redox-active disulfide protein 2
MEIIVLGPGCANCKNMQGLVRKAVKELNLDVKIVKVSDIQEIMKYTMSTPGLIVNGKLKHAGMPLPVIEKLKKMIKEEVER